jgi:hypothetical protein
VKELASDRGLFDREKVQDVASVTSWLAAHSCWSDFNVKQGRKLTLRAVQDCQLSRLPKETRCYSALLAHILRLAACPDC